MTLLIGVAEFDPRAVGQLQKVWLICGGAADLGRFGGDGVGAEKDRANEGQDHHDGEYRFRRDAEFGFHEILPISFGEPDDRKLFRDIIIAHG